MRIGLAVLMLLASSGLVFGRPTVEALVDARVVMPGNEVDFLDGGLGKLRYGGTDGSPKTEIAQAAVDISMPITSEISTFVSLRWDQVQRRDLDVTEAYVRYRPVSTTPWRWSLKLGAFYPPISLENTEVGWTSPWTITPSAINTWVGEELRTLGGEGQLEWRSSAGTLAFQGALYEWNDPAGVLIAYRGWALSDHPTGLFDRVRLPDAVANAWFAPKPLTANEFKEIDGRPGYYAGASWRSAGGNEIRILRYDNRADPAAFGGGAFAWDTNFWSLGGKGKLGDFTVLSQGMAGETSVEPAPGDLQVFDFQSAYLLLGRQWGPWRVAARGEAFATHYPSDPSDGPGAHFSEHGQAFTLSGSWDAFNRLRLSAEAIRMDTFRVQREFMGLAPEQNDIQLQLNARLYL